MTAAAVPTISPVESIEDIWAIPYRPCGCEKCGQAHLIEHSQTIQICPSCMERQLEPQPALLRLEGPEKILPFQLNRQQALNKFSRFVEGVWLRPGDFNPESLMRRAVPVFLPMWLVDGVVSGDWQAEAGFDYQVKSSQEMYQGNTWKTKEVIETRVRWEKRMGQVERRYDNISIPALTSHGQLWRMCGGWPADRAGAYQPSALKTDFGPASLRVPDLNPEEAWPLAESGLKKAAGEDCTKAAGAQHIRDFRIRPCYEDLHWTLLLLPVLVSAYTDDNGKAQLVYINGMTGAIQGRRLASQRKGWRYAGMAAAAALVCFLLALLSAAAGMLLPPIALLSFLFGILALGLAVLAVVPAVWPWYWNRSQQGLKVK
jgi:hypothetical protein